MQPSKLSEIVARRTYKTGSTDLPVNEEIINKFHEEVVKQLLIGNKVMLPGGIKMEIVKTISDFSVGGEFKTQVPKIKRLRLGFEYHVRFNYYKVKRKRVKFEPDKELIKKLTKVLEFTDLDYRLVNNKQG